MVNSILEKINLVGPIKRDHLSEEQFKLIETTHNGPDYSVDYYFAKIENKIIAYAGLSRWGNGGWLGPSYVDPDFRGNKIQKFLINKRIELANELGYNRLITKVNKDNKYSLNNLLDCGFKIEDDNNYQNDKAFCMKMSLDK